MKTTMIITEQQLLEVKGFMDLGFDIANPDMLSPRVMQLIPGLKLLQLQQLIKDKKNGEAVDVVADKLIKDYLRQWARCVARKAVLSGASS